jgi:triosephosphate isomerase (TIM)
MSKLIYGNWKMNLSAAASAELAAQVACAKPHAGLEIVVFPSFTALPNVVAATKGMACAKIGAQNCFWEDRGAFTGEISPSQLKELGCTHVLVGHSERRRFLGETDEMVGKKIKVIRAASLIPVVCVGESDADRRAGRWASVIEKQVSVAFADAVVNSGDHVVIAYEPIWAVGTGVPCEPQAAHDAHALVRNAVAEMFGMKAAEENFRFIYGGSVDVTNIASYLRQEGIDGALVGGASQRLDSFAALLDAAAAEVGKQS